MARIVQLARAQSGNPKLLEKRFYFAEGWGWAGSYATLFFSHLNIITHRVKKNSLCFSGQAFAFTEWFIIKYEVTFINCKGNMIYGTQLIR